MKREIERDTHTQTDAECRLRASNAAGCEELGGVGGQTGFSAHWEGGAGGDGEGTVAREVRSRPGGEGAWGACQVLGVVCDGEAGVACKELSGVGAGESAAWREAVCGGGGGQSGSRRALGWGRKG